MCYSYKRGKNRKVTVDMRVSLKTKSFVMIFIITAVLCVASIIGSNIALTNIIKQQFISKAETTTSSVAAVIDAAKVARIKDAVMEIYNRTEDKVSNEDWGSEEHEAYIGLYNEILESQDFIDVRDWLRKIQDEGKYLYVYIITPDLDNARMIYVVDATEGDDFCMPGSFDLFTESDYTIRENPLGGVPVDIVNTEEYGWTLALGKAILDGNNELIAYICADSSMTEIMAIRDNYLLIIGGVLVGLALLTGVLGVLAVNHFVVRPVNVLSTASIEYCKEGDKNEHHKFEELKIDTKDEIGDLAKSMVQMEHDINNHVANLIRTANELIESREKEAEMTAAANIDEMTQVKNKRAFVSEEERLDREIKAGNAEFALAVIDMNNLKAINDTYGHEEGDQAVKDLCAAICETFKRSPVFRIGGDEFAVVLEKSDLKNREKLFEEFRKAAVRGEEKKSWRGMSAALGCEVYNKKKHNNFSDVFKAADANMYENKSRMKHRDSAT